MHTQATPRWMFGLLGLNFLATVFLPLLMLPTDHVPRWSEIRRAIAYPVAYGNSIAISAILLMPPLVRWLAKRGAPLVPVVAGLSILFTALGCLIGAALLVWAGVMPPSRWPLAAFHTFREAAILAVVFGLGSYFYAVVRDELQQTAARLHEKELSEERARNLAIEARLSSLESHIRPHFLFNTLNSISSLIPVEPRRAEEIVGQLAGLLRSSLDTTTQPLIPLEQELRVVQDYAGIEAARLGDKLRWRIDAPQELQDAKVPPFSIQCLAENAVKHAIACQRGGGEFVVSVRARDGILHVEVSDTGSGFELKDLRSGHGLDNLTGRLASLFGENAGLSVRQRDGRNVVEMVLPRL